MPTLSVASTKLVNEGPRRLRQQPRGMENTWMRGALMGDRTTDPTREIPLTQGYVAIIDAADYDELVQLTWYVTFPKSGGPYAIRTVLRSDGGSTTEYMHRRLMPGAAEVDHINGVGLDNRRSNLRNATHAQNLGNRGGLNANNTSGYRGVIWDRQKLRWRAEIQVRGRTKFLGRFDTAKEAARARDAASLEYFGEFAGYLNFPDEAAA